MAKHGKKPTANERKLLIGAGKTPGDWLKEREALDHYIFINRYSEQKRIKVFKF